jgi:hypothetical protein
MEIIDILENVMYISADVQSMVQFVTIVAPQNS